MVENSPVLTKMEDEQGLTLIEVLVAIVLVALAASGVYSSIATSLRVTKMTEVHYIASSLATSRVEELAAIDISSLDSSYNETDTAVAWPDINIGFLRSTTVTVNADNSRTINVVVRSDSAALPTTVNFTTNFALWE